MPATFRRAAPSRPAKAGRYCAGAQVLAQGGGKPRLKALLAMPCAPLAQRFALPRPYGVPSATAPALLYLLYPYSRPCGAVKVGQTTTTNQEKKR